MSGAFLGLILFQGLLILLIHVFCRVTFPFSVFVSLRPIVTVMIPTSNKAKYLRRSFTSASKQTLSSIEILIVEDGSLDFSVEVISDFVMRDSRFRLEMNDKPLRGHTTRSFGVCRSKGVYILPLDCDDELRNRTAELDLQTAIERGANIVEHRAIMIAPDGAVSPFFWPARLQEADNVTLVRYFLRGALNWQLWLRLIERVVYIRGIELIGDRMLLQFGRAVDKLHCGAMFPFVRKFVTLEYIGYVYYTMLPESSYFRSRNRSAEYNLVGQIIKEILVPFVGTNTRHFALYGNMTFS
jgi:glycosyltransferase involved in cell wall biosynthesis